MKEKSSLTWPHVSSFNFTRDAFSEGNWDETSLKARGLFFNNETYEIVARSYDKFFNIGEREDTSKETIAKTFSYPITGYEKENGYLGLISYDDTYDRVFFTSKGTPDSDFARMLEDIFTVTLTKANQDALSTWVKESGKTLVVEVVEPVKDAHIISYGEPHIILLDALERAEAAKKVSYVELLELGRTFGIRVKKKAVEIKTKNELQDWLDNAKGDLRYPQGKPRVEGYVLESASGQMTKTKTPYYLFWKAQRGRINRMRRLQKISDASEQKKGCRVNDGHIEDMVAEDDHPLARHFLMFCAGLPTERLRTSIIDLRSQFQRKFPQYKEWEKEPWVPIWDRCNEENREDSTHAIRKAQGRRVGGRP